MSDKSFNPFKMAQQQFDAVADKLNLDKATRDLLRNPMREYHFTIPVKMDDGTVRIFQGFSIMTAAVPPRAASASIPKRPWTPSAPWPLG